MTTLSFTDQLRRFGRQSVGNQRVFLLRVALPQFVIFSLLIIANSIQGAIAASIFHKLFALAYIVVAGAVVGFYVKTVSLRLLGFYLSGMVVLLSFTALPLPIEPTSGVFLPASLLLLCLLLLELPWEISVIYSLYIASILIIYRCAYEILHPLQVEQRLTGILLFGGSAILLCTRSLSGHSVETLDDATTLTDEQRRVGKASVVQEVDRADAPQRAQLYSDLLQMLSWQALLEFRQQLPYLCILILCFLGGASFFWGSGSLVLIGAIAAIALAEFLAYRYLLVQRRIKDVYVAAFLICVLNLFAWALLRTGEGGSSQQWFADLIFGFLILYVGSLPWSAGANLSISILFFLLAVFQIPLSPHPYAFMAGVFVVIVISTLASAAAHLALISQVSLAFLRRCSEVSSSTLTTIRLLAAQMTLLANQQRTLIVYGQGRSEIVLRGESKDSNVGDIYVRGLLQKIQDTGLDEGIMAYGTLGEQFLPALADWFLTIPKKIFFIRITAVIDEAEETIVLCTPVSLSAKLAGLKKTFHSFVIAASLVRSYLGAARSRFLSSDVLLATQHAASQREHELSEIVHLVNNVAQDISIQCDSVKRLLSVLELADSNQDKREEIVGKIELLEACSRHLSAGVSDIKLLKELVRRGHFGKVDRVDVPTLIDDMKLYARYRTFRKGQTFEIVNEVAPTVAVEVASREFLETTLRLLLKSAEKRNVNKGQVLLKAYSEGQFVVFEMGDCGPRMDEEIKNRVTSNTNEVFGDNPELDTLRAVYSLAVMSKGALDFLPAQDQFNNRVKFSLPKVEVSEKGVEILPGHWALLVDDNIQVTTFYAKIAEALNLKYFTAASVEEADQVVEQHGKPRIVVTDIQLDSSSGLEIVKKIREKFGAELPVIVVSGDTGKFVAEEALRAGATKYLSKPVGRGKLFEEIRGLLRG